MKEIAVFKVASIWCGLDISVISEITAGGHITPVFGAAPEIAGIINLRGQIVTVLNLHRKLGFPESEKATGNYIVIIRDAEEFVGLQVDAIHDILPVKKECLEKKPSHLEGISAEPFTQVMKTPDRLIMLLDLPKIISTSMQENQQ